MVSVAYCMSVCGGPGTLAIEKLVEYYIYI